MAIINQDFGGLSQTDVAGLDTLFAGPTTQLVEKDILITASQPALKRGAALAIVSGKAVQYDPDDTIVGSDVFAGILIADTPIATGGDLPAAMYVKGQFNRAMVLDIAGDPLGDAAVLAAEAIGIYLKKVYP